MLTLSNDIDPFKLHWPIQLMLTLSNYTDPFKLHWPFKMTLTHLQKNEINQLKKDNDRLKESESSNETKLKWHQNKLKAEQDGHKVGTYLYII